MIFTRFNTLILLALACAVPLTGCKKVNELIAKFKKPKREKTVQAEAAASATPVPETATTAAAAGVPAAPAAVSTSSSRTIPSRCFRIRG